MLLKILNLIALIIMVFVNYLANALPLGGKTTGAVSAEYSNVFVPAGFTFSIWGIIYLMLIIFAVLQFYEPHKQATEAVSWLFIVSSVLNVLWLFAWHYERLGISVMIMLLLLASLIWINMRMSNLPYSLIKATFGIYLGWICIATIANVSAWLVSFNWPAFGIAHETWAVIMIAAGLLISAAAVFKFSNPFIALAVVWGFIGLSAKHQQTIPLVVWAALLSAGLLLLFAVGFFVRQVSS